MSDEQKPVKGVEIIASESLGIGEKAEAETVTVTTITPTGIEKTLTYSTETSSVDIVRKSIAANNIHFMPDQVEIVTETVERTKWLGAGLKISFDFLNGKFQIEKPPTKETKTITKAIYKASENK